MTITINSCTKTFTEIYESASDFASDYSTFALGGITDSTLVSKLYYLLYAKYANNFITNIDETQFKYKLFTIIFEYGPTWEKRLDIQTKLRAISDDDLLLGAKAIYNHAYNPSTEPSTQSLTELTYINDQNTTNYKKSKMDAYTQLWNLLATDVTEGFLDRFSVLFKKFISPFVTIEEDEEITESGE